MGKPLSAGIVLAAALALVALLGVDGLAENTKKTQTYKFVAPLDVVMKVADDLFVTLPEKADARKFKRVRREALFLAEISNLYRYADYEEVDSAPKREEWNRYVEVIVDGFLNLAEASKKKDAEAVKTLHKTIEETCEACHEKY